jgi:hypothetical protein
MSANLKPVALCVAYLSNAVRAKVCRVAENI